jgi:hypothetical protein
MTFFYDLNKKLDSIREKPELTHGQLNERDLGKHNNATTGFAALAKKTGGGEKGARIAGAQLAKMRAKGQVEESDMEESAFQAAIGKKKYGDQGMKALQKAGRDHASDKTMSNIRNKYDKYDEGMEEGLGDAVKRVGGMAKKVAQKGLEKLGHGSDADMMRDLQRKMGVQPTGKKPPVDEGDFGPMEGSAPMTPKQKSFAKLAPPTDKITFADKIAGAKKEVDEMLGDVAAEAIKSALSPKQKKIDMNKNGRLDANDFAMLRGGKTSNGGTVTKTKTGMKHSAGPGRYGGSDEESHVVDRLKGPSTKNLTGKQETDEGWDDMIKDVEKRRTSRRVGDITHGDKHDTQEVPGGRRVTRRVDPNTGYSVGADSDEPAAGEKRGRGRPKGAAKGPERVTSKATKHKGGRKMADEDFDITDRGEYDQEGEMAKDDIKTIVRHAQALEKILGDNDNLPEWVQAKLAKIEGMMTAVDDYMQNQEDDDEMAMGEEKTSTRDNRAERAGKKVAKDIEYDEKKKDGIHGKKRGSEDDKAEKAGKKVAKDIEYDEKKDKKEDKPKKVKEEGGSGTPTASSGFSYGKGIYDSINRELESMISESMSINMSDSTEGGKSLTITASDEDAIKLGMLLKSAGLGGDHGDEGSYMGNKASCSSCGMSNCGCGNVEQAMDEAYGDTDQTMNKPDWPTDTETSADAFQYSGGLDGPKSTGQTTVPVIAHQDSRMGVDGDEDLRRMMEMAGVDQADLKPWERTMKEELDEGETCSACDCDPCECDESVKESLARFRSLAGIQEAAKPDFLDVDKDSDKKEAFKKAVKDKEKSNNVEESIFKMTNLWKSYKG